MKSSIRFSVSRSFAFLCALAVTAGLISGCAREVVTTKVQANGAWKRTVVFHGPKPDKNGAGPNSPKLEDIFVLPAGPEWKVTKTEKDDESIITAVRSMEPGQTLSGDITVKSDKEKKVTVVNQVTIKRAADGKLTYTESIHWKGDQPKEFLSPPADQLADIKKVLPANLATDANVKAVAIQVNRDLWGVFFGPNDPLMAQFSQMLMQPEMIERRIMKRVDGSMDHALVTRFGNQLTANQRMDITRKLIHGIVDTNTSKTKNAGPDNSDKGFGDISPVSLMIVAGLPGKVTETNGEVDPAAGEVFWSFFPQAAATGDVTLTATCDPNQQSASR